MLGWTMRKLQGGLEASLHRVGHPSFLVYFHTQAKPSYWSTNGSGPAQPVKPAAGGRSGELGSASAFPLQQAAAVVASWGGSRRGEAEERWRSRARGWPWSSSSASARLTASRLVSSFLPFLLVHPRRSLQLPVSIRLGASVIRLCAS